MHKCKDLTGGSYRINLVDEHTEVGHVRVVPTKVRVAHFHATVVQGYPQNHPMSRASRSVAPGAARSPQR